jgi:branched-chain amino acid transport system ATP-binding protein
VTSASLELMEVSRSFGGFVAVDKLSLAMTEGEVRCVVGPNGAGKTTTFNLIAGSIPATRGRVIYRGEDISNASVASRAAKGIARSFQTPRLCEGLTVFEHVRLAVQSATRSLNPIRRRADSVLVNETWTILDTLDLADRGESIAGALSHGDRGWLQLAMIAARPSDLVLLDEPTAGMNQHDVEKMTAFLEKFRVGRSILLVEHDMDFVLSVADTITVLNAGTEVMTGTPSEVRANEAVRAAYLDGAYDPRTPPC